MFAPAQPWLLQSLDGNVPGLPHCRQIKNHSNAYLLHPKHIRPLLYQGLRVRGGSCARRTFLREPLMMQKTEPYTF